MSENHEELQKELLDVHYGERPMTEKLKTHLATCSECAEFWSELNILNKNMPTFDMDIEIDERIIGGAFREARISMERSKNVRDLVAFVIVASLILGLVGLLVYMGYGKSIIVVQLFLMICVPLLVPFMIRHRLMKEEY